MSEFGRRPAEEFIQLKLPEGAGQQIIAAEDFGDAHRLIIDDDSQLIGRRAVGLSNHEIAEFGGDVGRLLAGDQVRKSSRRAGGTKSPGERYILTRLAALGPTMLAHGACSQRE